MGSYLGSYLSRAHRKRERERRRAYQMALDSGWYVRDFGSKLRLLSNAELRRVGL